MKLELVTVGTELVLGFTVDTNAAELGRALAAAGVDIARHTSIADRPADIRAAVADGLERTGLVLTTGGLGPTRDDMTKTVVAELLGKPLVVDETVLRALEARFRRLGRPMPAVNRTQAEIPEGATVLPNPRGTAPGLWVEDARGRAVILLPGVPKEMRGLLVEEVLPRLARRQAADGAPIRVVLSRQLRTTGVPESAIAERVGPLEDELVPLTLAYIPTEAGVDLRLTAWALEPDAADRRLDSAAQLLRSRLDDHYYGEGDVDLAAVVLQRLQAGDQTLAVAESCTGGLIGARVTAVPGASRSFLGGVIAYDDQVKRQALDVPAEILEQHGAVSEPAVRAMADGVVRRLGATCAIAVSGIAGPGGGTPDKPVGTVWIAVRVGAELRTVKRVFPGDRDDIRARATQAALDLLRRQLA